VQDVRVEHRSLLDPIAELTARADRLCELNVIEQARNVCQTTIVQDAWSRGQSLAVHGWIYGLRDGRLRDLGVTTRSGAEIDTSYRRAIAGLDAEPAAR
jgi:carbonic anhydrase